MMGGDRPEEMVKMIQEQNKVLAKASIQYLAAFTNALHLQAAQGGRSNPPMKREMN